MRRCASATSSAARSVSLSAGLVMTVRVQVRSPVRRLPWAGATPELVGRQGPSGTHIKDGRWITATASGGGSDIGDPARRHQHVGNGQLGQASA